MFGLRFLKVQPTTYVLQYKKGKVVREGAGMTLFYYAPTTLLVAVPMASTDAPFIFEESTADFQEIYLQGQVTYRIADPRKSSQLLNFSLDSRTHEYISDDPEKLSQRIINLIKVLTRNELQTLTLREALRASDMLVQRAKTGLQESAEMSALGVEVLGLSILSIKPNPETGRALEAESRERLLREADEAIYARRNAAVEHERAIRENELNTDIAVENKQRQVREARMDAELAVQEKQRQMREAEMAANIALEEKNKQLVTLTAENTRLEAEAKAYGLTATMKALEGVDPKMLYALASTGMQPGQLMALAFQGIADKADKIGQLNVTPELLRELLAQEKK